VLLLSCTVQGLRPLSIAPPPLWPHCQPPAVGRSSRSSLAQRQTTTKLQQMATRPLQTAMGAERRHRHRGKTAAAHAARVQAVHQGGGAAGISKPFERHCSAGVRLSVTGSKGSNHSIRASGPSKDGSAAAGGSGRGVRLPSRALQQEATRPAIQFVVQLHRTPASARPRRTMPRYGLRSHLQYHLARCR
jgi:hypothetical protein